MVIMTTQGPTLDDHSRRFFMEMRRAIHNAQMELRDNPDPDDPWWFLVVPDAYREDDPL
jgi:hypothetical protein